VDPRCLICWCCRRGRLETRVAQRILGYASALPSVGIAYLSTVRSSRFHSSKRRSQNLIIGDRLRALREEKKFSQGDIEKRTGLLRCYVSRVENGHTVPAIETMEKFARALEVPLYQLFYEGEEPPKLPNLPNRKMAGEAAWGSTGKDARVLAKFRRLLGRMEESNRRLLLAMAQKMAGR